MLKATVEFTFEETGDFDEIMGVIRKAQKENERDMLRLSRQWKYSVLQYPRKPEEEP